MSGGTATRRGFLDCEPSSRSAVTCRHGTDLDYDHCFSHGIRVLSCAPAFGPAVAEHGLGLALASTRQIAWTDRAFRTGEPNWSHTAFATEIGDTFTLYGKQIGMIGFGGLARSLRSLLAPFGCPIQVHDPWLTPTFLRRQGVEPVDLDTLLSSSRVIFVLATPSSSNRALLTGAEFDLISADGVLVLLSRAHVVDFEALTERCWLDASERRSTCSRRSRSTPITRSGGHSMPCCRLTAQGRWVRHCTASVVWSPTISKRSAADGSLR